MAESLLRPPALRPGDRVAVAAASGPPDQAALDRGLAALRGLGLEPDVLPSARAGGAYLAGSDALRAADLTRALTDPSYRAVLLACGGYGAQRTLELVDWERVGAPAPRAVVGYSDVTALLEAVAVRLGWASLFAPMPACDGFHPDSPAFGHLARLLTDPASVRELAFPGARALVPGTAEGVTAGGTATLLASSLGSATSRPARGAVLLLEDVDEEVYRLDRILTQLRRSGYLDGVAGIVCGTFTRCGAPEEVEELLRDRLGDLGVPVLAGADVGHGVPMRTFPIGVRARLDADRGTVRLLDPSLT
ncbi:LD-carboxypeptidase [Streptacidiphilus sp. ASG 303]|uniref:S66 peptidase family protein n=1 Tax=Streptacidiphilus sp. ASG 303 TaxID=2896847 RepID=UPI001E63E169|nr:LD-carboxypeptidase [Streptacidiphilus sp. ASG 303]MCD0481058.1 LD-carboxypeptidase [Streptacidiphilus sp. ASG 303]